MFFLKKNPTITSYWWNYDGIVKNHHSRCFQPIEDSLKNNQKKIMERCFSASGDYAFEVSLKNRIESTNPKVTSPGDSSAYFGWFNPLSRASLSTNHAPKKLAEGVGKKCSWPRLIKLKFIFPNIEKNQITMEHSKLNMLFGGGFWLVVNYWTVFVGCVFVCVARTISKFRSSRTHLCDICLVNHCAFCHTGKKIDAKTMMFFPTWYHSKNIWYHEVFLTNIYLYGTIQRTVIF